MPSAKHLRLYGETTGTRKPVVPVPSAPEPKVPDFAIEGGFVNDRSGEKTKDARKKGYRTK